MKYLVEIILDVKLSGQQKRLLVTKEWQRIGFVPMILSYIIQKLMIISLIKNIYPIQKSIKEDFIRLMKKASSIEMIDLEVEYNIYIRHQANHLEMFGTILCLSNHLEMFGTILCLSNHLEMFGTILCLFNKHLLQQNILD